MESKPRVLLIDDERFARQLYSDYLIAAGCDVECAESAQVARTLFVPGRYRLVVTDLLLPDSDGLSVLAEVKSRDPEVDVIVITGLERVEPAVQAIRGGASDYLIKPVTPETLELAVRRCFSMRRIVQENASLKSSLALFEASQRIAVAPDREHVAESVLLALVGAVEAKSGLLFAASPEGPWSLLRAERLTEAEAQALVPLLQPVLTTAGVASSAAVVPLTFEHVETLATVVPLAHEGTALGAAVLLGGPRPRPQALRGIDFLARSAALSLAALHRFDRAEKLAYLDDLTHLFNARYLDHVLDRELSESGSGLPFAVLFVDLDHFKQVNDTHGHLVGSRLLLEVARVLKACVREKDVCTRYGGDEFCVVLHDADSTTALRTAERIRSAIASHRFLAREGRHVAITASIGVACHPEHAGDKTALLELADQAMYRGKRSSRNVIYLASTAAA